ncbi:hypothetical protein HPB47_002455 [Ixodes persulcatus]|uniref:Uncharacterized protein n=1 Tax=Ixodes persulcatus TaxID=34615 RepID=A0AC60PL52_IXOPE|nr:hypothetical protein HPB47_002455 [Ixodes persulcatus]
MPRTKFLLELIVMRHSKHSSSGPAKAPQPRVSQPPAWPDDLAESARNARQRPTARADNRRIAQSVGAGDRRRSVRTPRPQIRTSTPSRTRGGPIEGVRRGRGRARGGHEARRTDPYGVEAAARRSDGGLAPWGPSSDPALPMVPTRIMALHGGPLLPHAPGTESPGGPAGNDATTDTRNGGRPSRRDMATSAAAALGPPPYLGSGPVTGHRGGRPESPRQAPQPFPAGGAS